ncbi:MAG: DNA-3-methyladenine glycosylase I [Acidimicrobiales bacterium]
MSDGRTRCSWCGEEEIYVRYHDLEWGVPEHDDHALFELLTLEGAQAGLSWLTVLRRREGYRRAFEHFDPEIVAGFGDRRVAKILSDPEVVRHRLKIASVITNARAVLHAQHEHGSFDSYVWQMVADKGDKVATAKAMSKRLSKDGFTFVGPTICLSFMQASGMVNDHARECFRFEEIEALRTT